MYSARRLDDKVTQALHDGANHRHAEASEGLRKR
jgi:hypothetical protein